MYSHTLRKPGPVLLLSILVSLSVVLATPGTSAAASPSKPSASPVVLNDSAAKVTSRITGTTEDGRKVKGRFTPSAFEVVGDTLQATGELSGRIPGEGTFSETVTMPVQSVNGGGLADTASSRLAAASAPGTCDILHLVLGPLDLDLLGLQVHLDQVVLDIVAKSGAGNLLGNLLCAVAGLLDGGLGLGALLDQLVALLNQILGQLGLNA